MSKFTSGEWKTTTDHSRKVGDYRRTLVMSRRFDIIANCYTDNTKIDKEQQEANALLISKAPKLYSHNILLTTILDVLIENIKDPHAIPAMIEAYEAVRPKIQTLLTEIEKG